MKTKRRQELKTNELAQALHDLVAWFNRYGTYVVGAAAVVVIVMVILSYMRSAKVQALDDAYASLGQISIQGSDGQRKSDEAIAATLTSLKDLARESTDEQFKVAVLLRRADIALYLATSPQTGLDPKHLPTAESAFKEIVEDCSPGAFQFGRAIMGLYEVEANLFALDGDRQRKETAAGYLKQVRDDKRLSSTPFMRLALDRLNELDEVFTPVAFGKAPTPAVRSLETNPLDPGSLPVTIPMGTVELKPAPADEASEPTQASDD